VASGPTNRRRLTGRIATTTAMGVLVLAAATRPARAADSDGDSSGGHAAGAPEHAADGTLEEVDLGKLLDIEVFTATKTAESIDDAPAVITVVTRKEIDRWGYDSVADVLKHTVGFYLVDDHILPNAGVRGMTGGLGAESNVIKLMIDGRSVAYRTTSGNWLGIELVPLSVIAQIEIIRGPASALYGADAFLGVVNIITVRPEEQRQIRARLGGGSTGDHLGGRFDLAGAAHAGDLVAMIAAAGEATDRSGLVLPAESPAPILPSEVGTRRTANNLSRRSLSLLARVGYSDRARGHLFASGALSGLTRGGDFAHWAQLTNGQDPDGRRMGTVIALAQLRLNLDGLLHLRRDLDLAAAATYFQGGVRPDDRIEIASDLFYVKRRQSYRGLDTNLELRWLRSARFNLIAGAETVVDHEDLGTPDRIDRASGQPLPQMGAGGIVVNLVNLGAYASANLKILDPGLKLTGGVRYDHHSVYGQQITGRAGLTAHLTSTVVGKLLYGSAFKAPSPYLLYAMPLRPGDVAGNRLLKPQRIHTGELQLSWRPGRFFNLTSGASLNWLLDKAEFTPDGINQAARNVASQRTLTWETRADFRRGDLLGGYGAFELVRSTRDLGQEGYAATLIGSANVAYPTWIARAGIDVALPSPRRAPIALAVEATLVGPRRAADTSIVENGGSFTLPSYGLIDVLLATRDLQLLGGQESRVALRARNLLGARGPDPGFSGFEYPLAPREIFLELQHAY